MSISVPSAQVLVVDDEPSIRALLRDILEDDGYAVADVADGAAALEFLQQTPVHPKLILLDVMMPIMDGITFLHIQQAEPPIAAIPVVLMSVHTEYLPVITTFPIAAVLIKPFPADRLITLVQRFCATEPR